MTSVPSDQAITQATTMKPILEIGAELGIPAEHAVIKEFCAGPGQ